MVSPTPALAAARAERRKIRWFFAGLLVAIGLLDVFQAMLAHYPVRDTALEGIIPTGFSLGGRTAAVVAGLALLLLARGISRGKRVAWQLTMVVLAGSVGVHLVKNLDFEEALIALWVLLGLWWMRPHFQAGSDRHALRRGLITIVAAIALAAVYVLAGDWLLVHAFGPRAGAPLSGRAAWFVDSLPAVAGALLLIGIVQVLRPVVGSGPRHIDLERARPVVARWGHNFVSWLSLLGATDHFWAAPNCYVAYRMTRRVAIALGDPVGPPGVLGSAVQAFHEFCDRHGWISAFYEVERADDYRRLGYTLIPIGSDAVVDLDSFNLEGRARADLRYAVRRADREGITFTFANGPEAWELEADQLRGVSNSWLRQGKGPEMGFSMGTLDTLNQAGVTVAMAHDHSGRLLAFASWLPAPGRQGWSLDLVRRRPDSTYGVMEALIVGSLEEARRRGLAQVSLGIAPLALEEPGGSRRMSALRLLYRRFDRFRGSRSLRAFKAKFGPRWEPRYLALPGAAVVPEVLVALLGVHLPRPLQLLLGLRVPREVRAAARHLPAA